MPDDRANDRLIQDRDEVVDEIADDLITRLSEAERLQLTERDLLARVLREATTRLADDE